MSFYLDDYPDDDRQASGTQICPNCSGTSFYDDPITGTLTCSSCYTQSQTATQEELDYDEGIGLAATGMKRTQTGARGGDRKRRGRVGRPLMEYDRSKRLPDVESCCLAFQWLLWDASKCVSKLAGIREEYSSKSAPRFDENERPHIMERTVKNIWFAYLRTWMDATREYSAKYPEMRVSFRDFFLEDIRKGHLMRHLSVMVGRKVENEILEEMQTKQREKLYLSDDQDDDSSAYCLESVSTCFNGDEVGSEVEDGSNSKPTAKSEKRKRQPFLTIAQLCKHAFPAKPNQYPNGIYQMHPHHAALKIQPSLTLLLSIIQLALTHLRAGVAPYHLTMWVANGQLPHGLNGYAQLPSRLKERVEMVKKFFMRSFVPPASVVASLTDLLATACSWYDDEKAGSGTDAPLKCNDLNQANGRLPSEMVDLSTAKCSATDSVVSGKNTNAIAVKIAHHQKSLYNVPLLAARMVQDFGFDKRVFNNTIALMHVLGSSSRDAEESEHVSRNESKNVAVGHCEKNHVEPNTTPAPLECASFDKLYTPLHVAAVIVLACKLCPGWETWKLTNLHTGVNDSNSDAKQLSSQSQAFVPWNESQLRLLGNGCTLNYYMGFLEGTVFNGVEPPASLAQFFLSLQKEVDAQRSPETDASSTNPAVLAKSGKITPNNVLSGAPNPNAPTASSPSLDPNSPHAEYNTANNYGRYTSYQYCMHKKKKVLGIEPYHPHYCRLLEFICFIIEETNTGKLHDMVEEFEFPYCDHDKRS